MGKELTQQLNLKTKRIILISLDLTEKKMYIEQEKNSPAEKKIIISKRENYIIEQRDNGRTYTSLAEELKISYNRVRQIYIHGKRKLQTINHKK